MSFELNHAKERLLEAVIESLCDDKKCQHDDFTFCPSNLVTIFRFLNIYAGDLLQRIQDYKLPENHDSFSLREYWMDFINYIIIEENDVDLYTVNTYLNGLDNFQ